jgi:probable HAF family extracellular repeat protein
MRKIASGMLFFFFCFLLTGWGQEQSQKPSKIIEFDAPGADQGTVPEQNNLFGLVTGFSFDVNGVAHGFVRFPDGKFASLDAPDAGSMPDSGQGTFAFGITDGGTVVGSSVDTNGVAHGFVHTPNGKFTTFDAPLAGSMPNSGEGTFALAINPAGASSGVYVDANGMSHGFVRAPDGTITSFDPSGSVFTNGDTAGINPAGVISGAYTDSNGVSHGFVRAPDGTITSFDAPGAGTSPGQGSAATMITPLGTTPGLTIDANNVNRGFLRYSNATFITFDVPGAGTGPGQGTSANASNLADITTGDFVDASNVQHGFVRIPGGKIFKFDAPDAGTGPFEGTLPFSINLAGEVIGIYFDTNGVPHGFLRFR